MAGKKGRSGRRTIKTEREVKEELQKQLPEAYEAVKASLEGSEEGKRVKLSSAWKVLDKFVADPQAVKVTGDEDKPLGVILMPMKHKKKADSMKSDTE